MIGFRRTKTSVQTKESTSTFKAFLVVDVKMRLLFNPSSFVLHSELHHLAVCAFGVFLHQIDDEVGTGTSLLLVAIIAIHQGKQMRG